MKKYLLFLFFLSEISCSHLKDNKISIFEKYYVQDVSSLSFEYFQTENPKISYKIITNPSDMFLDKIKLMTRYDGDQGYELIANSFSFGEEPSREEMAKFAKYKKYPIAIFYIFHDVAAIDMVATNKTNSDFNIIQSKNDTVCFVNFYSKKIRLQ